MYAFPAYTVDAIETQLTDEQMLLLVESRRTRLNKDGDGDDDDSTDALAIKALNKKGKVKHMNIEDLENMPGFAVEKVVVKRGQ